MAKRWTQKKMAQVIRTNDRAVARALIVMEGRWPSEMMEKAPKLSRLAFRATRWAKQGKVPTRRWLGAARFCVLTFALPTLVRDANTAWREERKAS